MIYIIVSADISISGNPVNCIELKVHFDGFPYSIVKSIDFNERFMEESSYMEMLDKPIWHEKDEEASCRMERRTRMRSIICNYYSFIGLQSGGHTTIGIKVEMPKQYITGEFKESARVTFHAVNNLVRFFRMRDDKPLKNDEKTNTICF